MLRYNLNSQLIPPQSNETHITTLITKGCIPCNPMLYHKTDLKVRNYTPKPIFVPIQLKNNH